MKPYNLLKGSLGFLAPQGPIAVRMAKLAINQGIEVSHGSITNKHCKNKWNTSQFNRCIPSNEVSKALLLWVYVCVKESLHRPRVQATWCCVNLPCCSFQSFP